MHFDFGTLIWVIVVVIGVISSMVKKARENAPSRPPAGGDGSSQAVVANRPFDSADRPQAERHRFGVAESGQDDIVSPPIIVRRAPPPPVAVSAPPQAPTHGTPAFRGMFERGALVRAIVAAEVLGPPKALQEQSIWSPRHSEPSI